MLSAQKRHTDQWNGIESPELNAHIYCQPICGKDAKNIHHRKERLCNKWGWENYISICKRMKLDSCFSPVTKINLKYT
jgi:hypothetical protein